jgi:hypothetical protein
VKFFAEIFAERSGKVSNTRVITMFVCVCVIGTWALVSIEKLELQELSAEQVAMVLGAMGLKAWQRGKETWQSATGLTAKEPQKLTA